MSIGRPLSSDERAELSDFLNESEEALVFEEACGFMAAIVSAPTSFRTADWLMHVLGDPPFDSIDQMNHVVGLVMRQYNAIVSDLMAGREVVPPGDHEDGDVILWCSGYLEAAEMDAVWKADENIGQAVLFPVTVLAREFDLVGEDDSDGNVITDATPQLVRCRALLDGLVHDAYGYWTAKRHAQMGPRPAKVGRNEPCPCGSGRKYKKCCGLAS